MQNRAISKGIKAFWRKRRQLPIPETDIYHFYDLKKYLKAMVKKGNQKRKYISYPLISKYLGVNSISYSYRILHEKKKYFPKYSNKSLSKLLKLKGNELKYYNLLFHLTNSDMPMNLKKQILKMYKKSILTIGSTLTVPRRSGNERIPNR